MNEIRTYNEENQTFNKNSNIPELKVNWLPIKKSCKAYSLNVNIVLKENTYGYPNQNNDKYFISISNKIDGENFRYLYKSDEISGENKNFIFDPVEFLSSDLCLDDEDQVIKIEFYTTKNSLIDKKSTILGYSIKKLKDFKNNSNNLSHDLLCLYDDSKLGNLNIQIKEVENITENHIHNLIEKFNLNINLSIAIDFTSSNQDIPNLISLHDIKSLEPNQYIKAINTVGKLLGKFDNDQKIPVYGFGAFINSDKMVSHCFNINMNKKDPNISGIENVIKTYEEVFQYIELSGPTKFSFFLEEVLINLKLESQKKSPSNNYHILLILCDGYIYDFKDTADIIVELSRYPISIIIIGIGNNQELNDMKRLGNLKFLHFFKKLKVLYKFYSLS